MKDTILIPGFHPDAKSDDELHNMLADLTGKLAVVARLGSGSSVIEQIQAMIMIIRTTLSERQQAAMFNARVKSQKDHIESDPDLAEASSKPSKADIRGGNTARRPVPRMFVARSKTPTNQISIDPPKET